MNFFPSAIFIPPLVHYMHTSPYQRTVKSGVHSKHFVSSIYAGSSSPAAPSPQTPTLPVVSQSSALPHVTTPCTRCLVSNAHRSTRPTQCELSCQCLLGSDVCQCVKLAIPDDTQQVSHGWQNPARYYIH